MYVTYDEFITITTYITLGLLALVTPIPATRFLAGLAYTK
jgi:hypothetical protein